MNITPKAHGIFYPKSRKALLGLFNSYPKISECKKSKLIIIPHAGYEFSGSLAFITYQYLNKDSKEIVVITPAIYNKLYGTITSNAENTKTPIGTVKIKSYDTEINNKIFQEESSIGVQLPFIKYFFPESEVIPIIYGCEDYNTIFKIIENKHSENANVIIVTNLSRFIPAREALKLDNQLARLIEKLDTTDLDNELADGAIGVCAAIKFAKKYNMKFVQTGHNISSDVNGDTSSVVGYGGWYLTTQ